MTVVGIKNTSEILQKIALGPKNFRQGQQALLPSITISMAAREGKLRSFSRGLGVQLDRGFDVGVCREDLDGRGSDGGHLKLTIERISKMNDIDLLALA